MFMLFITITITSGSNLPDRLLIPRKGECKIGILPGVEYFATEFISQRFPRHYRVFKQTLNCSFVTMPFKDFGSRTLDANGSYIGILRKLRNHEVDGLFAMYRIDYFPVFPGHFTSQGNPAETVIHSKKNVSFTVNYGLIEIWTSAFDRITVLFLFNTLFVFAVILTHIQQREQEVPLLAVFQFLRKLIDNFFTILISFIDRANFDEQGAAGKIITIFFNFFLLFCFHGFVSGSMGAELVAMVDPPIIESFDAFTNKSYTQPVIGKNQYVHVRAMEAVPGSLLYPVRQAFERNPNQTLLDLNFKDLLSVRKQLADVLIAQNESRLASIEQEMFSEIMKPVMCEIFPDSMAWIKRSKNSFMKSMMASLMSEKIDPDLRFGLNHLIGSVIETGQTNRLILEFAEFAASLTDFPLSACGVASKEFRSNPTALGLSVFAPIFKFFGILCFACGMFLAFECRVTIIRLSCITARLIWDCMQVAGLLLLYLILFIASCVTQFLEALYVKFIRIVERIIL